MKLNELAGFLAEHPASPVQIILPDDSSVPNHFHVTEVGLVRKDFIDCGGTVRSSATCVLQLWVANDLDHRLDSSKLLKILELGQKVLPSQDLPVELEYERRAISQYPLVGMDVTPDGIQLHLGSKHTACLAPELCLVDSASCCGPSSNCC